MYFYGLWSDMGDCSRAAFLKIESKQVTQRVMRDANSAIIIKISHSAPIEYEWGGIGNEKQKK